MKAEIYGFRSPLSPWRTPPGSWLPVAQPPSDVWLLPLGWKWQIAPWPVGGGADRAQARLVGLFCVHVDPNPAPGEPTPAREGISAIGLDQTVH